MKQDIDRVMVKYNGRLVGYLWEMQPTVICFKYDGEWLKSGFSVSPFSLPLSGEVFTNKKKTFDGLHGVFWDSLPDGWGGDV